MLLPGCRVNQLSGLEILEVIVGNRGNVENDRSGKKRECHQSLDRLWPDVWLDTEHKQQRSPDHDQNTDAGEWAVGRTDQPSHVTADG